MADDLPLESDRLDGAPHPRDAARLFGHAGAEADFLAAASSGRLPHGWLLTGPKGVGKATFAWRAAKFLLSTPPPDADDMFGAPPPPESLDVSPDHPVSHRIAALSEPGLFLLRRPVDEKDAKKLKTVITVDEVRGLKGFFHMSAGNARRVVIVDSADEMNPSAANALLKELEEPPEGAVLFLISHRPSGLLPTIRSRCRTLRFNPLGDADLASALLQAGAEPPEGAALATLAQGSVGEAIALAEQGGPSLYADICNLLATLPTMDRQLAIRLAEGTAGKANEGRFTLTLSLLDTALSRAARLGATGQMPTEIVPNEAATLQRLAPTPGHAREWANLAQSLTARARRGKAVNLDPAALVFDIFLDLDRMAARLAA
ncbi:DNA polymerase III subunit delta' [Gymnodinialimonas ceratoperidinii]|uniref:DNA polymerase III subunit delta n=1 Tax=Gymnodinialimonas ceratoperidinii TaxID=2856823 RepID=A0A8F6Y9M0_9RHOB|nr:DNA polymerase III subunit delta' [Gymnodinialimonas ceratoperidinii]QXT39084.1 DNA polymerase III subunit delta' [Gymnodinialimonas ceratoperidinii]